MALGEMFMCSGVDDAATVHADFPGTDFIAGGKTLIKPQASTENLGMVALVKVNEQIADILPQAPPHDRIPFKTFDPFPIRNNQFVNTD